MGSLLEEIRRKNADMTTEQLKQLKTFVEVWLTQHPSCWWNRTFDSGEVVQTLSTSMKPQFSQWLSRCVHGIIN